MDVSNVDMAIQAIQTILEPARLGYLFMGVLLGLGLGLIPGLGGLVGLALLLPVSFAMEPFSAFAMLIGLTAVVATSDTIPAVLLGIPGTVASAATVMDGYPMAKKGLAGRALGASFMASLTGGLFGAMLLFITIPILRPALHFFGSPELLALCIFGLSMVASLSGGSALRGIGMVVVGLLLAEIGDDPQTSTQRWAFGTLYLWDGIPIVPVALGIFAIPKLIDLAISGQTIAPKATKGKIGGQWAGIRDVVKNWWLVLRCSSIGVMLGAIPGLGASVIDWVAYGHALRTEKGAEEHFGKGDVRGVIASESSNNAKDGGALVPTLAFGVPGTASMALLLAAFQVQGFVVGPEMLNEKLDVTYAMVWSLAIANILGAGICFLFANQLAKIVSVRPTILLPIVLSAVYIGAFQGSQAWGDFYVMLALGLVSWVLKRLNWPLPPIVLGFVLGLLIERYLFISIELQGYAWLGRPIVIAVLALTSYGILAPIVKRSRKRKKALAHADKPTGWTIRRSVSPTILVPGILLVTFVMTYVTSYQWPRDAGIVPRMVSVVGAVAMVLVLLTEHVLVRKGAPDSIAPETDVARSGLPVGSAVKYFAWLGFVLLMAHVLGLLPALAIFTIAYMRLSGHESPKLTLLVCAAMMSFFVVVFDWGLNMPWPYALIGDYFPALRSLTGMV